MSYDSTASRQNKNPHQKRSLFVAITRPFSGIFLVIIVFLAVGMSLGESRKSWCAKHPEKCPAMVNDSGAKAPQLQSDASRPE